MSNQKNQTGGCLTIVLIGGGLALAGNMYFQARNTRPPEAEAPASQPEPAAPSITWTESTSSDGLKQRKATMSFETCEATRATTIDKLNVSPANHIEIVNTNDLHISRICLAGGASMLITCSRPDNAMVITETSGGPDVGCPE